MAGLDTGTTVKFAGQSWGVSGKFWAELPANMHNPAEPADFWVQEVHLEFCSTNLKEFAECVQVGERSLLEHLTELAIAAIQNGH